MICLRLLFRLVFVSSRLTRVSLRLSSYLGIVYQRFAKLSVKLLKATIPLTHEIFSPTAIKPIV